MSSPGLKRPLELEQHLDTDFFGFKRRCGVGAMHQQQQHQFAQLQHQQQNLTQHHHHPHSPLNQQNQQHHHQQQQQQQQHPQPHHNLTSSPFKSSILAPVGDEVARVIKDEIINNQSQQQNRDQQQQHQNPNQSTSGQAQSHNSHQQQQPQETPVLSVRQTQIICEKLIKEREQKLREEYDRILMGKLAEQYETFVKYTHDHLERNSNSQHQASYLS